MANDFLQRYQSKYLRKKHFTTRIHVNICLTATLLGTPVQRNANISMTSKVWAGAPWWAAVIAETPFEITPKYVQLSVY